MGTPQRGVVGVAAALLVTPLVAMSAACAGITGDPSPTPASTGSGAEPAPSSTSPGSPASGTTLAVSIEGLALVDGTGTRPVEFGADRATVSAVLTQYLGPVTSTELPECGQGPRTALATGPFNTLFDGELFVGWSVDGRGRPEPPTTLRGIGIGSTLADVQSAYEVSVTTGTLGVEFFTRDGQFGGLLDAEGPGGTVTELHAGETCFFR